MAVLFASVAPEVKTISRELAPRSSATCPRAVSITAFNFAPNR
jgi:hypothetical protein